LPDIDLSHGSWNSVFDASPEVVRVAMERSDAFTMISRTASIVCITLAVCYAEATGAQGSRAKSSQSAVQQAAPQQPWMNTSLDPDVRADLMIHEMTLDEKIQLVHGVGWGVLRAGAPVPPADNGGAGFVPGIPRLHLPDINLADSAVGVRMAALEGRYQIFVPIKFGQ